ncbi:CinA family protein [Anaplasma capra]|uniref:CinA family protein n=1 Tax=Anaplasma capra TaxID=1562740 RepID=UPI0021D5FD40|nr:CinA family protein [Anaplasma capra]MCU7611169.1 CinA family protein [Anaplasma capra]MCU7612327.1 CinA family protein [Anaplasma capra]
MFIMGSNFPRERHAIIILFALCSEFYMLISKALIGKAEVCIQHLRKRNLKVSFAESCTGGLLSFVFSCVPGVSDVLFSSVVVYKTHSKCVVLEVPQREIEKYGVVSEQVAGMMAEGALRALGHHADIVLSVTGTAGHAVHGTEPVPPDPETGTVYMGLARRNSRVKVRRYDLGCITRFEVQEAAVEKAIDFIEMAIFPDGAS